MPKSFKEVAKVMDPAKPPISLRELHKRHRWLNEPSGKQEVSLREVITRHSDPRTYHSRFLHYNSYLLSGQFHLIDYVEKGVGGAVQLLLCLGFTPQQILSKVLKKISPGEICSKLFPPIIHIGPIPVPGPLAPLYATCVAFSEVDELVNFLLKQVGSITDIFLKLAIPEATILQLFGIDLNITVTSKRLIPERALEIGQEIIQGYDLMSLVEVWRQESVQNILKAWGDNKPTYITGNDRPGFLNYVDGAFKDLGSGLLVISPNQLAYRVEEHTYQRDGVTRNVWNCADLGPLVDSDRWATKGVLMTKINLGVGILELFTTHLYSGGDLLDWHEVGLQKPSEKEKSEIRDAQIVEFIRFFAQHHDPRNIAILAGDFNIPSDSAGYKLMKQRLEKIQLPSNVNTGFLDAWLYGVSDPQADKLAGTNRSDDSHGSDRQKDFAQVCQPSSVSPQTNNVEDFYCNDYPNSPLEGETARIDYIFIEKPLSSHTFNLDISRIRRRTFKRQTSNVSKQNKEDEREYYLSDHLGLDTVLIASPQK